MAVTIGPHTISRAQLVPVRYRSRSYQTAQVAGDYSVAVSGSQAVERLFSIRCRIPVTEAKRIIQYIENSLRFRAETCEVTDGYGVTRTMRYWDGDLDAATNGGSITELDLTFREEVPA